MDTLFTYNKILEYVEETYNVMLDADDEKLNAACDALVKMTPAPMNTMLEKQPKEDAIQKTIQRKERVVVNVPPTGKGYYIFSL